MNKSVTDQQNKDPDARTDLYKRLKSSEATVHDLTNHVPGKGGSLLKLKRE